MHKTAVLKSVTANRVRAAALTAVLCVAATAAQAQLFGDDQARQAILELRQRLDQTILAQNRLVDENAQMRRNMLELQQQLDALRGELAALRDQNEQLARSAEELRRHQEDTRQTLDERMPAAGVREGQPVADGGNAGGSSAAGAAPLTSADEKKDYDAALDVFRAGDFKGAQKAFAAFVKSYPRSGLAPSALFWLGNAQYATRNYKEAISNFRSLLTAVPKHERAPEAMLAIANCQLELKDQRAARATLEQLLKTYPQSEAAQAGKERLGSLK
ncbi:MAG: tol-pal system protein YbgF [Ottowia sp.]|nr:tol-pal system protein YbgF [Ottowia sp.]